MSRRRTRVAAPVSSGGWRQHLAPLLTLPLLAMALYVPCLDGPFVYDDLNAVSQSALVRSLTPVTNFLRLSTRPLTDYSYAVNYAIGALSPRPYHATHLLLHAANTALVYAIAWLSLGAPALAGRYGAARRAIAWAGAALFAAHPLASETVAYVSSRSEILAAFWYLLGVFGYALATAARDDRRRRLAALLLLVASAAGLASKEIAITLPAALLLYEWAILAGGTWRRARPRWRLIGLAAAPLALGGAVLALRAYTSTSPLGVYGATAGLSFDRFGPWQYLLTQFGVVVHYLRLVVLPIGQTFDYDWPLATSPLSFGVALPLLLLLLLAYTAWRTARTQPLFTFAVGWTLLILTPTSSILPIADLAVERRMYLPLAGLMWCAAAWLYDLSARLPAAWRARPTHAYALVLALPLVAFAALTWQRAALWGDDIALQEDGVRRAPGNPRARLNLGVSYLNRGQYERAYATLVEAKRLYDTQQSVQAFPRIGAFIHYNLGAVLVAQKHYQQAEPQIARSLELGGQYLALRPMAFFLRSRIAAQRGEWSVAADHMREALRYRDEPSWRVDFARYTLQSGNPIGARLIIDSALQAYPGYQRAEDFRRELER